MHTPPWISPNNPTYQSLIHTPEGCKILIDSQRYNAHALAHLWTTYQLCLNSNPPCGHCQSCHLNSQHTHPDSHYYDQPNSIDQIRHLLQKLHTTPLIAPRHAIYLGNIDQYHPSALNALLKTLEEPPTHSHFLLSAASRRAVLPTLLSRSQLFTLDNPSYQQALDYLTQHHLTPEQAKNRLQTHNNNPYLALTNDAPPLLEESLHACLQFLINPKQHPHYLQYLDNLPPTLLLDYISAQIQRIIQSLHYQHPLPAPHDSSDLTALLQQLNLNTLHTLYATLSTLRRPEHQALNLQLSVKSILLNIHKTRRLTP